MPNSPSGQPFLLGVRHHGPGSARAVAAALAQIEPDVVLIEGPPEADVLLSFAADPDMRPPVALLAHAIDDPAQAGFWPYADFSPEWVAIRYATDHGVPVRFIDLPVAVTFALDRARKEQAQEQSAREQSADEQSADEEKSGRESGEGESQGAAGDPEAGPERPASIPSPPWPGSPARTTPSAGGRTSSSIDCPPAPTR